MNRRPPRFGPVDGQYFDDHDEYVEAASRKERKAFDVFEAFLHENADLLSYVSHFGDGQCGELVHKMREILLGTTSLTPPPVRYRKKKIDAETRLRIFKRDGYRCVKCGCHYDLSCDHIFPESKGGEATDDNLQTLCRRCNSAKGARIEAAA